MSDLIGCDQCGGSSARSHAKQQWFRLMWNTGETSRDLFGVQTMRTDGRDFCSLACVGLFTAVQDAFGEKR